MEYTDQLGRTITLEAPASRIVSLVPSQTELLYDLGLRHEVAAITRFCTRPAFWHQTKKRIGGTKDFKVNEILELKPDLILANKEENDRGRLEELEKHFPVWISDVNSLSDACSMMDSVASMCGKANEGDALVQRIEREFQTLSNNRPRVKSAVYLIWRKPWMTAGRNTFIHEMLQAAGFDNLISANRYPELSLEALALLKPEVLMLSTEPYPFSDKHVDELRPYFPNSTVMLVDGEAFSWYGSRMVHSVVEFRRIHQQLD